MKRQIRWIACMLVLVYSFSITGTAFAAGSNTTGQAVSAVMDRWVARGLIEANSDVRTKPGDAMRRVEWITLLNRIFGYSAKVKVSFPDVAKGSWYEGELGKAVAAGYLQLEQGVKAQPFSSLNRLDAAVMLAKAFDLKAAGKNGTAWLADEDRIPSAALPAVAMVLEKGLMKELAGDRFSPWSAVTRAEAVEMLDKLVGGIYNKAGTYTASVNGTLIVNTTGVTLRNMTVSGDLYLSEGIGEGNAVLENVTVKGRTLVRGGGPNSIVLKNSTLQNTLVIDRKDGLVRVVAEGTTEIENTQLKSGAFLEEKDSGAKGFKYVLTPEGDGKGQKITLKGSFHNVDIHLRGTQVQVDGSVNKLDIRAAAAETGLKLVGGSIGELNARAPKTNFELAGGRITRFTVQDGAEMTRINAAGTTVSALELQKSASVDISSGMVEKLVIGANAQGSFLQIHKEGTVKSLSANAASTVKGQGRIDMAVINADNVFIERQPGSVSVASGVVPRIGSSGTLGMSAISLTSSNITVVKGGTRGSGITYSPSLVTLKFSSSHPNIASVDPATGTITGVSTGSTTIYVTAERTGYFTASTSFTVTVTESSTTLPGALALQPSTVQMGTTQDLTLTYTPGEPIINGTVTFALPEGIDATTLSDMVKIGAASPRNLFANQINGRSVVITGVNLATSETVVVTLNDKVMPGTGSYTFTARADADGNGPKTLSEGTGNEAKNLRVTIAILAEGTHYKAPEPGAAGGTVKLSELSFGGIAEATKWQIKVQPGEWVPPAYNSTVSGITVDDYQAGNDVAVSEGQHLILLATDAAGQVKAYRDMTVTAAQIKPFSALDLPAGSFSLPEPGAAGGTTQIASLTLDSITGAQKWQIKVQDNAMAVPNLNTTTSAIDYTAGRDIAITAGQHLILFATDSAGRIKAYRDFTVTAGQIRAAAGVLLAGVNYEIPVSGTAGGTTRITQLLNTGFEAITTWRVKVQNDAFPAPALDSVLDYAVLGAVTYTQGGNIGITAGQHLILLGTDDAGRVKGYADMVVTADKIRPYDAIPLTSPDYYSVPVPGQAPGTTRITTLDFQGMPQATRWRVKVQDGTLGIPLLNSTEAGTTVYTPNTDIAILPGQYLILLAADDQGRTKGYASILMTDAMVKGQAAPLIINPTNYSDPVPGSVQGTCKFQSLYLGNINGATKWQVLVSPGAFDIPVLNSTVTLTGADIDDYQATGNIAISAGYYLLLLATDNAGQIKAYREFVVQAGQIKAPPAVELKTTPNTQINYTMPEMGSTGGTTRINTLSFIGVPGAEKWMYKVVDSALGGPLELDSTTSGALNYTQGTDIAVTEGKHLILLATDKSAKIKGYADITITAPMIKGLSAPVLETPLHYSVPEAGDTPGTTKIRLLSLGTITGAVKWQIVIRKDVFPVPEINATVSTVTVDNYTAGTTVSAVVGDHLVLLATDAGGKIKAYKDFTLTATQIKAGPAVELTSVNYSEPEPGATGGTTKMATLNLIGVLGATRWQYKVQSAPFGIPDKDSTLSGAATYMQGASVGAAAGQYLILLAVDDFNRIKAYKIFALTTGSIRPANSVLLQENIQYTAPVAGTAVGETRFMSLSAAGLPGFDRWQVKVQDGAFEIPVTGSILAAPTNSNYTTGTGIAVKEGQHLLLLAVDAAGGAIAYRDLVISAGQIKAPDAILLVKGTNYNDPVSGSTPGTTKIPMLEPIGILGFEKWMIKVQAEPVAIPAQNSVVSGAIPYMQGGDISITSGQAILLLATDISGKVKAYAKIVPAVDAIRPPNALILTEGIHFSTPQPGPDQGTTMIAQLSTEGIASAVKWQYKVQSAAFSIPSQDSIMADALPYTQGTTIAAIAGQRLLLLAVGNDNTIKAYKEILLAAAHIRVPDAKLLTEGVNYSAPEPGTTEGKTKIATTSAIGIADMNKWQYKVQDTDLTSPPGVDTTMTGAVNYTPGNDISIMPGQYLILLATDSNGRIKAYRSLLVTADAIRSSAAGLVEGVNFSTPEPGPSVGTTVINTLSFGAVTGAAKWQIKVQSAAFGTLLKDSTVSGAVDYTSGTAITVAAGQHVLLMATDGSGRVKAFKDIMVAAGQIRAVEAAVTGTMAVPDLGEADIVTGGKTIIITLSYGKWADDIATDSTKRNALFDGLMANSETAEWSKVVTALKNDGEGAIVRNSDTRVTITLAEVPLYNISVNQSITLVIPASAIQNATSAVTALPALTIRTTIVAAVTGTASGVLRESDIRTGGRTMIVTLANGQWMQDIASNTTVRDALYEGFVTDSEPTMRDALVAALQGSNAIVRNSSTKITITLPAVPAYDITQNQTLTLVITAAAISGAVNPVTALPALQVASEVTAALGGTVTASVGEADIASGGKTLELTLTGGRWATDITTDTTKRNALFEGIIASSEATEWAKVINALKLEGQAAVSLDSVTKLTVMLPAVSGYNIINPQNITVTIPAASVQGALSPIPVTPGFQVKAAAVAVMTGTVISTPPTETDIANGGKTLIVTLTNAQWEPDIASSAAKREALYEGLTADSEPTEWAKVVAALKAGPASLISRNSNTQITVTLPPVVGYDISTSQKISLNITAAAITGTAVSVTAAPSFTVSYHVPAPVTVTGVSSVTTDGAFKAGDTIQITVTFSGAVDVTGQPVLRLETGTTDRDAVYTTMSGINTLVFDYVVQPGDTSADLNYAATGALTTAGGSIRNKGTPVNAALTLPAVTAANSLAGSKALVIDTAAPVNAAGYPKAGTKTDATVNVLVKTNESGRVYAVALPAGAAAPSAANVKAGRNAAGVSVGLTGSAILTASLEAGVMISGLSALTAYDIYLVTEDTLGNLQATAVKVAVTTNPEVIPPVYEAGYPTLQAFTGTTVDIAVRTDEKGKAYFVALPGGAAVPTSAQIKTGKNAANVTVAANLKGTVGLNANEEAVMKVTGLVGLSIYDIYVVCEDAVPNLQTAPVRLTQVTTLEAVDFDVAAGLIKNTTMAMEYSLNSTDGKNGTWTVCSNGNTSVAYVPGTVYVRAISNWDLYRSKPVGMEEKPDTTAMDYDVAKGVITGTAITMEYRLSGGAWQSAAADTTSVVFIPGVLEVRTKATRDNVASISVTMAAISAQESAPGLLYDDGLNKIYGLSGIHEYKIGTGSWVSGLVVPDLSGTKAVQARVKATKTTLPSLIQTMSFTADIDLTPVILDVKASRLMGTTTSMEYSTNSQDGVDGNWYLCAASSTVVSLASVQKVYIREKGKSSTSRLVAEAGPAPAVTTSGAIDALYLEGASTTMEYTRDGGASWWPVTAEIAGKSTALNLSAAPNNDLRVRSKATSSQLASRATVCLTPLENLAGVGIDVAGRRITGTKTTMEYSLNSTNGKDGTWMSCTNPVTLVTAFTAGDVFVRVKAQPTNYRQLVTIAPQESAPSAVLLADGTTQEGRTKIILLDPAKVYEFIVDGNATLADNDAAWSNAIVIDRKPSFDNVTVSAIQYLHIRVKGTTTKLASAVKHIDVQLDDIKPANAPNVAVDNNESTAAKIRLNGVNAVTADNLEYNLDGAGWVDVTDTTVFNLVGTHVLYVRIKATNEIPPSNISDNLD